MSSNAALHRLLSKPNAVEAFNLRVNLLVKTRTVDEGTPRTESQMIKSFSTLRQKSRDSGTPKFQTGDSAVIVPLVESKDGQPWVLFTHRSYLMRKHRGEIAFPGGKIDENETVEQAAIREAEEEIGLKSDEISIWGRLPSMITRHNTNVITPVVGQIAENALKRLDIRTNEVQSIFIAPLDELSKMQYTAFRIGSTLYKMPVYHTENYRLLQKTDNAYDNQDGAYRIWGITGGILNELLGALLPPSYTP